MSTDDRRSSTPEPVDPLSLAEAVAAGRLAFAAAEAALWEARPNDEARAAEEIAELRDLVAAIRGVRRHADAVRKADLEVFDPDADRPPLGAGQEADADRDITPRRVHGDVRLRPSARPRQRWAPVGALAAAAVLIVAAAVIVPGLLTSSVASSAGPSASQVGVGSPSSAPSATVSGSPAPSPTLSPSAGVSQPPTPRPTGVAGVPPIASQALAGAPGIAYWTLTSVGQVTITEWRPDGGAARFRLVVSTVHDPNLEKGDLVDRRIVVAPDGRRVVFAESTTSFARTRVFATDGTLLWTDPTPTFTPDLAWSADGTKLVVGSQPATFKILTFGAAGEPTFKQRIFDGAAYRVLGFSASATLLYGWDTQGEADFWQTPFRVGVVSGDPVSIAKFSGATDPLAVSNGTTDTTQVDPAIHGWSRAGVDPKTGRVLDTGDLSGQLKGWEIRDGSGPTAGTPLELAGTMPALSWGPDGSIVAADLEFAENAATITIVDPSPPHAALGPAFQIPSGDYWRAFAGSRGDYALLELGSPRVPDWLGADELVTIDLATARTAVFAPAKTGFLGIHPAGWVTGP